MNIKKALDYSKTSATPDDIIAIAKSLQYQVRTVGGDISDDASLRFVLMFAANPHSSEWRTLCPLLNFDKRQVYNRFDANYQLRKNVLELYAKYANCIKEIGK